MFLNTIWLFFSLIPFPFITSYWNMSQDYLPDTFILFWLPIVISTFVAVISIRINVFYVTLLNLAITILSFISILIHSEINPFYYEVLGLHISFLFTIIIYVLYPFFVRALIRLWGVRIQR